MPVTFTPFLNGDPMTRAGLDAELVKARDYVNGGIVNGDIAAEALTELHVYRPETYGFPTQGTKGALGDVYFRNEAIEEPGAIRAVPVQDAGAPVAFHTEITWGPRRKRQTIFMDQLGADDAIAVPQASVPLDLDEAADVEVKCNYSACNAYDHTVGPLYPNPSGYFILCYRDRATGTVTEVGQTRRELPAQWIATGGPAFQFRLENCYFETEFLTELPAGSYDVFLRYARNGANVLITQIVTSVINFVVEVHRI